MVLRKLRTQMASFLWFALIIFVLSFVLGSLWRKFSLSGKSSHREEGIVGTVNKVSLHYDSYATLVDQYRKQGMTSAAVRTK